MTNPQHTRNLRLWIMQSHAIDTPAGKKTLCGECGVELTLETMTIGHWPVPKFLGGPRTRNNVRPECFACNNGEGDDMGDLPAKLVWEIVYERATGFVYRRKMAELGLKPVSVPQNFGKVYRRAKKANRAWVNIPENGPHRPRMWRVAQ